MIPNASIGGSSKSLISFLVLTLSGYDEGVLQKNI